MLVSVCLALLSLKIDLAEIGRLKAADLREISGVVASRRAPGLFWAHNDSGNRNELIGFRLDGRVVARLKTPFPNIDWEDIAADGRGRLYLGDTGNNFGRLPLRTIYRFDETNTEGPIRGVSAFHYAFRRGEAFDCEGLFIADDRAWLVTKRTDRKPAELMTIPLKTPNSPLRPFTPTREGELPDFVEPATGADLSADGTLLAVCSSQVTRVYRRDPDGRLTTVAEVRYKEHDIEAVAWDRSDLILMDEPGRMYRVTRGEWSNARPGKKKGAGR